MGKILVLDAVRGVAAFYVVLHHLNPLRDTRFAALFHFGQEAVVVFFVLSGFVIYHATAGSSQSIGQYFSKRFLRIYPIFSVSLLLAGFAATLAEDASCITPSALAGNLLMLQDADWMKPGVAVGTFCKNSPLWSLSYEWWFYSAFAVLVMAFPRSTWRARRVAVACASIAGILSYQIAPNGLSLFASYLAIWWAGVELAREYCTASRITLRGQCVPIALVLLCLALWMPAVLINVSKGIPLAAGYYPGLFVRHFATALLCLLVVVASPQIPAFLNPAIKGLARLGSISFGVYVCHYPIIGIVELTDWNRAAVTATTLALTIPFAYFLERVYQPAAVRFLKAHAQSRHRYSIR